MAVIGADEFMKSLKNGITMKTRLVEMRIQTYNFVPSYNSRVHILSFPTMRNGLGTQNRNRFLAYIAAMLFTFSPLSLALDTTPSFFLLPTTMTISPCLTSLNIEMASECVRPATGTPLTEYISSPERANESISVPKYSKSGWLCT